VLLWPQQIQQLFTKDITYAGWLSCTVASSTALGQICAGAIVRWGGNVRWWLMFSTFAMVAFVAALAGLTPSHKDMGIAFTIIGPFFVGVIELVSLAVAPLFCDAQDIGLASGLLASIRSAGGSVAVTIYTTVLSNRLTSTIPDRVVPAAESAGLDPSMVPDLLAAIKIKDLTDFSESVQAAVAGAMPNAYADAFRTVYLVSLAFGGIAIVGCFFVKDAKKHLTSKVERKMHTGNPVKGPKTVA
jgi:hypothetical protein